MSSRIAMIKLKDLLTEQGRTWNTVAPTIPTKYPTTFLKLKHSIKSAQALSQFSEEGKQKVGDEFNKFVEQNGKNRVARRGKIKAAFNQLPPEEAPPTPRDPVNEAFTIDCKQLFGENLGTSQTINQDVMTSVSEYIKKRKAELKQQYPDATTIDIGLVNYKITATTSKVPSADPGNKVLADQRYNSMKRAFIAAANKLKIPGAPGEELPALKGESGPEYVKNDAKYGPQGNRNATYEKEFGPHRQSYITFTVDILVEQTPEITAPIPGARNEVFSFSLKKRSFKITLPPFRLNFKRFKMYSTKVPKPGFCPAFDKRRNKL